MALFGALQFNIDFVKWELVVFALLALLSVFFFRAKKIRGGIIFLAVTLGLLVTEAVVRYFIFAGLEDVGEGIRFAVSWLPTVIFTFIVYYATVIGVARGFRKSAILLLHAVVIAGVMIALFFLCVNTETMDAFFVKVANLFLGDGGLQSLLGVSSSCTTGRQVLMEFLPTLTDGMGAEIAIIMRDNGAYLMTLVDMAYHIVFGLLFYILYLVFVFIMYIVYHIAYSERKYRRRVKADVVAGKTDKSYRRHTLGGGIIGFARGLATALIVMSCFGTVLYIGAGGTGDGKLEEYSFGDESYDFMYSVYRSVESYGDQGIFKLLNMFKGTDNSPYYLFAADVILSGKLEDPANDINASIKFRHELGAYTGFARETAALLIKYGGDDVAAALRGEGGKSVSDVALSVMTQPDFRAEFESLIDGFEAQTYIINFALGAVNSLVAAIDETSFRDGLGEDTVDLVKLLFSPDYLSPNIPDEADGSIRGGQPHFTMNQLFNKQDAKVMFRVVTEILSADEEADALALVRKIMPHLGSLSILDTSRSKELDPVFARLYTYAANVWLSDEESSGVTYTEVKSHNVSWIREINTLLSVAEDGLSLYDALDAAPEEEMLDKLLGLFDRDNPDYSRNLGLYDSVAGALSDSKLLGEVLSTDLMKTQIGDMLAGAAPDMYMPDDLVYNNVYDESGNLVETGELHNLLYGMRMILTDENYRSVIRSEEELEIRDTLKLLEGAVKKADGYDNSFAGYITDSKLLRSLISDIMITEGGESIVVPYSACEPLSDGRMINRDTLYGLFECIAKPGLIDTLLDIGEDTEYSKLLRDETLMSVLDSGNAVIEGTIAYMLIDALGESDYVVVPSAFTIPEGKTSRDIPVAWLTDSLGGRGELRKLLNLTDYVDIGELIDSGSPDGVADEIMSGKLSREDISVMFESKVLHYTVSYNILSGKIGMSDDVSIIVPTSACTLLSSADRRGDVRELIKSDELVAVLADISKLELDSDSDTVDVLRKLINNKNESKEGESLLDSYIISASMAHFIATQENFLDMPEYYAGASNETTLKDDVGGIVPAWQSELKNLLDAIDALFDLENVGEGEDIFSAESLETKLGERMKDFNGDYKDGRTRLEYCCGSNIVLFNMTTRVDGAIADWAVTRADEPDVLLFDVDDERGALTKNAKERNTVCNEIMYKHAELRSLINAMNIFGFDGLFGEGENEVTEALMKEKAQKEMLGLNEQFENTGESKLRAMYGSYIIRAILTNEIDVVFDSEKLYKDTREGIKSKIDLTYPETEIAALVDTIPEIVGEGEEELGEKVNSINFDSSSTVSKHAASIYDNGSLLLEACITFRIKETDAIVHNDKAYMDGHEIYSQVEVESLMKVFRSDDENDEQIGAFDIDALNADILLASVESPDFSNAPASYLVATTLTHHLIEANGINVPFGVIENDCIISPELVAIVKMFGDDKGTVSKISDWSIDDVPKDYAVFESVVVRATVTASLRNQNAGFMVSKGNAVAQVGAALGASEAGEREIVEGSDIVVINREQITAIMDVLNDRASDSPSSSESGNSSFALPTADILLTLSPDELKQYGKCDFIRYALGKLFADSYESDSEVRFGTEDVYMLADGGVRELTLSDVLDYDNLCIVVDKWEKDT